MLQWLVDNWITFLVYFIFANFFAIIAGIIVIVSLPSDYLVADLKPTHGVLLATLRNVLGALLSLAGAVMLLAPGPGMLTIFCGLVILHSEKKQMLLSIVTSKTGIRNQVNAIRQRFGKTAMQFPERR